MAEKDLYNAVRKQNVTAVCDALKNGAKGELEDEKGWTALDVAAFDERNEICDLILRSIGYRWQNGETKCPFEKIMTKHVTTDLRKSSTLPIELFYFARRCVNYRYFKTTIN